MLITENDILPRFMEHLSWATEIDLATAWATSHEGLRALQRHRPPPDVRAVVGRWGNLTDPFALRMLATIGRLHGPDAGRHFHPKVFIFRSGGKSVAWVGSANFTSGGFGMNDEAVFETSDAESVQEWFDDLWEHTDPLDAAAIDAYAESRKNNPPPPTPRPPNSLDLDPLQLLEGVTDWQSYVAALEQCDGWWSNRHSWSVLGEQSSWRETAEILHDVVAHPMPHLSGKLGRALRAGKLETKQPPGRGSSLADLDQQFGEALCPEGLQVPGVESFLRCHIAAGRYCSLDGQHLDPSLQNAQ